MSHGLFESLLGSEAEVGMAKQAASDKFAAAVYDVREKLGPSLFASCDVEEFRDRVAMMKNDQSLFKVIEASGLHPATGIVRRIAGKNSILENEFRQKLAADPAITNGPGAEVMSPTNASDVSQPAAGVQTQLGTTPLAPDAMQNLANRRRANDYAGNDDRPGGPSGETRCKSCGGLNGRHDDVCSHAGMSNQRKADFEGVQDIDSTFSHDEQGKELKPKDNWKGYLNSVDQGAPSKVKRNFASKQDWNLYRAWCDTHGKSAVRISSLDVYAANLNDTQYLKLATTIQAWENDHKPKIPNTDLDKRDKVSARYPHPGDEQDAGWNLKAPTSLPDKGRGKVEEEPHHPGYGGDFNPRGAMRQYVAWCDRNGYSKVAKSTIDYYVSKVAADRADSAAPGVIGDYETYRKKNKPLDKFERSDSAAPGVLGDYEMSRRQAALRKHLYAQVATSIRWARTQHVACWPGCHENEAHVKKVHKDKEASRRTAAPDYLQKADDALTQLLNQKAQEFQETIAPLQQALQTVQQAEQLQQQANPMNVLPPAGTVNVMPGGDPSTADQMGMPDPNAQDTSGLAALLSGAGGTAPNDAPMGDSAPPPAAGGQGALPPEMDPNQGQQLAASRRRAKGVGEQFDSWKNKKTQGGDLLRGGDPDYEQFANETGVGERALTKLKQRNQKPDFAPINGVTVGKRKRSNAENGTSDDFHSPAAGHQYEDPAQQSGWKMTHADDDGNASWSHPTGHSVTGRDGPDGGHWQLHGPQGPMGHPHRSPESAQRSMPRSANRGKARGGASPQRRRANPSAVIDTGKHSIDDPDNAHGVIMDPTSPYTGGPMMHDEGADLTPRAAMRKGAPFAGYEDFDDCTSKNSDKDDSSAYCGEIKHRTEDKKTGSRKQSWSGWGPAQFPKTRKVAGWDWDDHQQAYLASAPRIFTCGCGHEHQTPNGYQRCKCGKAYNSYVIGTGGSNKEASADQFLVREIPVRPDVIVGSTQGTPERKLIDAFSKTMVQLRDPRTGKLHNLIDPGELDEGTDPGHSTFSQPPKDWSKRGDGAKWLKKPIG